jgi:hypothetical protein
MKAFILEYNEKQRMFHHNYGQHEPDKDDWFTLLETCTDEEFWILESVCGAMYGREGSTIKYKMNKNQAIQARDFTVRLIERLTYNCTSISIDKTNYTNLLNLINK